MVASKLQPEKEEEGERKREERGYGPKDEAQQTRVTDLIA